MTRPLRRAYTVSSRLGEAGGADDHRPFDARYRALRYLRHVTLPRLWCGSGTDCVAAGMAAGSGSFRRSSASAISGKMSTDSSPAQTSAAAVTGKRRDVRVQHVGQVVDQAPAEQADGLQHLARRNLVQRARRNGRATRSAARSPRRADAERAEVSQ